MQRAVMLDKNYIRSKYRDLDGMLSHGYPFVIMHNNVIDYMEGRNQIISHNPADIKRGMKIWKHIKSLVESFATTETPATNRLYILGVYNNSTYLVSDIVPVLPRVPHYLGIIDRDEGLFIDRAEVGNIRRVYINILKLLIKGVVVKPLH